MMIEKIGLEKISIAKWIYYLVLVAAVTNHVPSYANTDHQNLIVQAPLPQARQRGMRGMDDRIKVFSQALNLDDAQQTKLRKVLESQREQIIKLWSDSSLPAANRIGATQAISDSSADQIRAFLNEEQRNKYNSPRQSHEATIDSSKRSVEDWMELTKPKQAESSL